jgi:hypothetical protein
MWSGCRAPHDQAVYNASHIKEPGALPQEPASSTADPLWGLNDREFLRILAEDDVDAVACLWDDEAKQRRFQESRQDKNEV